MPHLIGLHRRAVIAGMAGMMALPARAAKQALAPSLSSRDGVTVIMRDLSSRFLDFYKSAQEADPATRYVIWKQRYGFPGLPQTPEEEAFTPDRLDEVWPRYAAALPAIRAGATAMRPVPIDVAGAVADVLQAPRPLRIDVTAFVGAFDANGFTADSGRGPVVAIPLEINETARTLLFPHQMAHGLHALIAKLAPGYERSLGRLIFEEGLAMHVAKRLKPGLPDFRYVGERTWFDGAMAARAPILSGLATELERRDAGTLSKFSTGRGNSGRRHEANIAGWLTVGHLLAQGATLPELARIPEAEMPEIMRGAIHRLEST